jgi:hypothetical protein
MAILENHKCITQAIQNGLSEGIGTFHHLTNIYAGYMIIESGSYRANGGNVGSSLYTVRHTHTHARTHIPKGCKLTDGFRHTVQQETLVSAAYHEFKYKDFINVHQRLILNHFITGQIHNDILRTRSQNYLSNRK